MTAVPIGPQIFLPMLTSPHFSEYFSEYLLNTQQAPVKYHYH